MRDVNRHTRHDERHSLRSRFVNLFTALTVNAAIVLSVPVSTSPDPAPIVLQRKRRLIDDRWHEGEYVPGPRPQVVLTDITKIVPTQTRFDLISDN